MKTYKLAAVIMRAQLPTEAHFKLIEQAHEVAERVIVLLGSANKAPQFSNPFDFALREKMIKNCLSSVNQWKTTFFALKDFDHMEHEWEIEVNRLIAKAAWVDAHEGGKRKLNDHEITLVVHKKDATTYYADSFPQYAQTLVDSYGDYNATDLRKIFFGEGNPEDLIKQIKPYTRVGVLNLLEAYAFKDAKFGYEYIRKQYAKIQSDKKPYENLPWGIKFQTADNLVICGNNVLLVQRGDGTYGEDQWALPGGYINQNEVFNDAVYRELFEETVIDVPKRALKNAYKGRLQFDGAKRDERGDFTTQCGIFVLEPNEDGTLPLVRGSSDAKHAKWYPFEKLRSMERFIFLDHAGIIEVCRRYVMVRNHFVTAM